MEQLGPKLSIRIIDIQCLKKRTEMMIDDSKLPRNADYFCVFDR